MKGRNKLVIIDNDYEFVQKFKSILACEQGTAELGRFNNFNSGVEVCEELITKRDQFSRAVRNLREIRGNVLGVFVDVVLLEYESRAEWLASVELIRDLRLAFPELPIILITRHMKPDFLPAMCWASLEDVDGLIFKQYLLKDKEFMANFEFGINQLQDFLSRALKKRLAYLEGESNRLSSVTESEALNQIENLLRPDLRAKIQIGEWGGRAFVEIVEQMMKGGHLPGPGALVSSFKPGYSGSVIFLWESVNEERYLLKLGKLSIVENEHANTKHVQSKVPIGSVPSLVFDVFRWGNIGGFAMRLEDQKTTLRDYLIRRNKEPESFSLVAEKLLNSLRLLWGNRQVRPCRPWSDPAVFKIDGAFWLQLRNFMGDCSEIFLEKIDGDTVKLFRTFVDSRGESERKLYDGTVRMEFGEVHGDLQARNILVDQRGSGICVIDFEKTGTWPCLADIANFEIDLVVSVLDSGSANFYDWSRLSYWRELIDALEGTDDARSRMLEGDNRVVRFAIAFRRQIFLELKDREIEYLSCLLFQLLRYVRFHDISIQKKALALVWVRNIVERLQRNFGG